MDDKELGRHTSEKITAESANPLLDVEDDPGIKAIWSSLEQRLHHAQSEQAFVSHPELYKSWVRWLHRLRRSSDADSIFCTEGYWTLLQQGFRPASAEQRRYCLYILGKSIALLDQDVNVPCFAFSAGDSVFIEAYEKYCTLFSTFVLDRYINQVEECLPELRDLAAPAGQVDPSWIIVLLGATLHHGTQDSVRKAVGDHFMHWGIMGFPETAVWPDFLTRFFLPWACQGTLFTCSITKSGNNIRCEHGERLADFIDRLVHLCSDEADMLSLVRLLLQHILDSPKLFPYAGAYILRGMLTALEELASETGFHFGVEEKELAVRIIGRPDLPEIVREAWRAVLQALCVLNQQDEACPSALTAEQPLIKAELDNFHRLQSAFPAQTPNAIGPTIPSSMQELLRLNSPANLANLVGLLQRSNHQCLRRDGLIRGMAYYEESLKHHSESDEDLVHSVLLALWTEVEIQDYPKSALLWLAKIAFSDGTLNCMQFNNEQRTPILCAGERWSSDDEPCVALPPMTDFQALVVDIWSALFRLSRGRIYMLAALTKILHDHCLDGDQGLGGAHFTYPVSANGLEHVHEFLPVCHVLPLHDFVAELASNPPRAKVEFQLEAAVAPMVDATSAGYDIYTDVYGEPEGIAYAYVFAMLNQVTFNEDFIDSLLNRIRQPWLQQQLPVLIVSKWKHTIQLQLMLVLLHYQDRAQARLLDDFVKFLAILAIEPMPRYRFLLQWIIMVIYWRVHSLPRDPSAEHMQETDSQTHEMHAIILEPLRKVEQDNPKYLGALLKIGVAICKMEKRRPSDFPMQLMTAMVAMCASPKIVVRHEAQWGFVALWNHAKAQTTKQAPGQSDQWADIVSNPVVQALSEYMQKLDRYTKPPAERLLEEFDFDTDDTLTNLFQGSYLRIDPPEAPLILREDFIRVLKREGPGALDVQEASNPLDDFGGPYITANGRCMIPLGKPIDPALSQSSSKATENSQSQANDKPKAPLQTKAASWHTVLDTLSDKNLNPSLNRHVRPIVVFASHIASAVNLGGLSRASEVFGAEALVVAKADVIKDKAFLGVSVNSHLHIDIEEVKPDERTVLAWLDDKRRDGYGVVGVEQTDRSTVLGVEQGGTNGAGAFPKKCVLVMGSEREGIPGWLLAECDAGCVEIPQVGVTRSLNVQTAAAVALYEYGRLHR